MWICYQQENETECDKPPNKPTLFSCHSFTRTVFVLHQTTCLNLKFSIFRRRQQWARSDQLFIQTKPAWSQREDKNTQSTQTSVHAAGISGSLWGSVQSNFILFCFKRVTTMIVCRWPTLNTAPERLLCCSHYNTVIFDFVNIIQLQHVAQ